MSLTSYLSLNFVIISIDGIDNRAPSFIKC